ncbi:MAG: heptosyltransferase [Bacteroidetes bacterium SW_11_45_7]|nr:MAG: heptosyltransferase [Bacteroidetes bacterium SW_11_45_7]
MTRFLVIQTAFIGDVILATPVLEKLRSHYPNARIDFLVRKGHEPLVASHPSIDEVLTWSKQRGKYSNFFRLIRQIRQNAYTCVVNLHRFASSGLLTAFSTAKDKIGFDKNPLAYFFTRKVSHKIGEGTHEVERNLHLVHDLTDQAFVRPKLYPQAPASIWLTKQLPVQKWVALINQIPAHYQVYLFGGPEDRPLCQTIDAKAQSNTRVDNLSGKLTFLQSAALMQGALMNYVNDSAPLHIASAMNAPTTAVFCSTVPRFVFGPLSDHSWVVETPIDDLYCRPCGLHGYKACPESHFRCATSIDPQQLMDPLQEEIASS